MTGMAGVRMLILHIAGIRNVCRKVRKFNCNCCKQTVTYEVYCGLHHIYLIGFYACRSY